MTLHCSIRYGMKAYYFVNTDCTVPNETDGEGYDSSQKQIIGAGEKVERSHGRVLQVEIVLSCPKCCTSCTYPSK